MIFGDFIYRLARCIARLARRLRAWLAFLWYFNLAHDLDGYLNVLLCLLVWHIAHFSHAGDFAQRHVYDRRATLHVYKCGIIVNGKERASGGKVERIRWSPPMRNDLAALSLFPPRTSISVYLLRSRNCAAKFNFSRACIRSDKWKPHGACRSSNLT